MEWFEIIRNWFFSDIIEWEYAQRHFSLQMERSSLKTFTNLRISSRTFRKLRRYIKRHVSLPTEILLSLTHLAPQRELHCGERLAASRRRKSEDERPR